MNFTLPERLQLVLALTLALTSTVAGMAVAVLVLGRLAVTRRRRHEPSVALRSDKVPHGSLTSF